MSRNTNQSKHLGPHERAAAIFKSQIPASEKLILLAISHHLINKDECWPSQARIAQLTGYRRRSVIRVIQRLTECGILKARSRSGTSCIYEIDWHRMLDDDNLCPRVTPEPATEPVTESHNSPVTESHRDVTDGHRDTDRESHGRWKETEKKVEPPEGGNPTRAEKGGEKLLEQESESETEEEVLVSLDRLLRVIRRREHSTEKRLAAVISFQASVEQYLSLKPPKLRKNIDVMESLSELDSEVRAVDLLDAIAAIQLNDNFWTVLITDMNWDRIKRAAANQAGYRLFRENGICNWHHDPSDTALEAFCLHQAKASQADESAALVQG